jgi:outer membrane receptor protein involved in Fe transport
LAASYALTASAITEYKPNPALVGKWLNNVPRQQGAVSLRWADPEWFDSTLRMRAEGLSYANDLNTLKLQGYVVLDLYAARAITGNLQAFLTINNLLDKQVITGRTTSVTNIGEPFMALGGLKMRF